MLVISLKRMRAKLVYVCVIYGAAVVMNVFALGVMGWTY